MGQSSQGDASRNFEVPGCQSLVKERVLLSGDCARGSPHAVSAESKDLDDRVEPMQALDQLLELRDPACDLDGEGTRLDDSWIPNENLEIPREKNVRWCLSHYLAPGGRTERCHVRDGNHAGLPSQSFDELGEVGGKYIELRHHTSVREDVSGRHLNCRFWEIL